MARDLLEFWAAAPDDPFEVLFQHAPVWTHSIDKDGNLLKVSRSWANALGRNPRDMIGHHVTEFMSDDSRQRALETYLPAFLKEGQMHEVDYDFVDVNGNTVPVKMSAVSQYDTKGNFLRSLAIIWDNALGKETERLRADNKTKSRFLAAMGHEIRNPMNAVLGFAQLLRRSNLDSKQAAQLDAIISAANNLTRLLGDLLDLSRLEAGKMRVRHEPFNLHRMIDEVMDLWHSNAFEKGLRLRCTLDRDVPAQVSSDIDRIRQVLNNVLSNAIKYTNEGVVTLVVEEVSRDVLESVVRFSVIDTGVGIEPEAMETLFQPFEQTRSGLDSAESGWGLGLSICQHVATIMSAKLTCAARPDGPGTVFTFEIPLKVVPKLPELPKSDNAAMRALYPGKGLRVLVAEDNIMNQDVIESMLVELGHSVSVVSNGFEAVSKLEDQEFDLVLMDISLQGLDGVAATEQIRNFAGQRSNVPIIAVTGNVTSGAREMYRSVGMTDYIPKPVSLEDLGRVIYRVTSGIV